MKNIVKFPERSTIESEAAEWLVRLDDDESLSTTERAGLREWLARSPAHRSELEYLAKLWGQMNVLTDLAVPLGKVKATGYADTRMRYRNRRGRAIGAFAVAAALVLAVFLVPRPVPSPDTGTNGYYSTAVGQQRKALLDDGSSVLLNTNSQIKVEFVGAYRNVVLLQGEAHFTVAKDASRPFRVYAGNGRIQAVGTAFAVHMHGDTVDVTVTEGRVALASVAHAVSDGIGNPPGETSPADPAVEDRYAKNLGTISAGQVGIVSGGTETAADFSKSVQTIAEPDLDRRLSWRDGMLTFSGESLADAVGEISRYTTVQIDIDDPAIKAIRIGGRFPVGETGAMFAALETNFGLRVTQVGRNHVVISADNGPAK